MIFRACGFFTTWGKKVVINVPGFNVRGSVVHLFAGRCCTISLF
jgi:hypothetical protein